MMTLAFSPYDASSSLLDSVDVSKTVSSWSNLQEWHQLIVIGNGFDLECGLPSSFSDFMNSRKLVFSGKGGDELPAFIKTIWDVILSVGQNPNWCDVEGAMAKWIEHPVMGGKLKKSQLDLTLCRLNNPNGSYDSEKVEDASAQYLKERFKNGHPWDKEKLTGITRDDLRQLESDFSEYLSYVVGKSHDYASKASNLMSEIASDQMPSAEEYAIEESVLSFNYTDAARDVRSGALISGSVNIHGKIGNEIVFGIDGTGQLDDREALPFTKTYRIMALDHSGMGEIVRAPNPRIPNHPGTRVIKFYGHSLGEADYSYFQSIFDSVNLYGGETRLIFYFRPHLVSGGEMQKEDVARVAMMDKVINLLSVYGKTLDNKDHGKNLIHKLLIEGRLSVKLLNRSEEQEFSLD